MTEREKLRNDLILKYSHMMDTEPNCDTEPWHCKVCGHGPISRLFAVLEHCLAHVRKDELETPRQRPPSAAQEAYNRPLDLD